jgi:urease accessory protein
MDLDNECNAIKCPKEIRQASQKLGLRLIKIFKRRESFPLMEAFEKLFRIKKPILITVSYSESMLI